MRAHGGALMLPTLSAAETIDGVMI